MTTMDNLELWGIRKNYEGKPLLRGIDLQVRSGETLCLLGRSGSGKSTLLRIIAGLENADAGEAVWNGENLGETPAWQRHFGLMFQDYALFPHYNVAENVAFGLRMQGMQKGRIDERVRQVLDLVSMTGFEKRRVTDLSGGEQQRIALARALAPEPRLLMLDEPLAALDRALRLELQEELRGLLHRAGIPAIYVTHDQEEALTLGDRVAILADGVIEQQGSPREVYEGPRNCKVAEFLGMTNFVTGRVVSQEPLTVETGLGRLKCHSVGSTVQTGEEVTLLLQSHGTLQSGPSAPANVLTGRVGDCLFKGDDYKIRLEFSNGDNLTFHFTEAHPVGEVVKVQVPVESILCLNK